MEKKHILIALAAIMLVVGSVLTVRAVRERNQSPLFKANLEAILGPEFLQPGTGDCFDKDLYIFTTSALFLPCDVCCFYFGVPIDPWPDGNC
ncbi:MAG: hypothetical protein J5374_08105 [Bacteroidales bacterium]|nr:hypothetical protein [Bacteroidales bacterium]